MTVRKNCKLSFHFNHKIKEESKHHVLKQSDICNRILDAFFTVYDLNNGENGYMSFINNEYLLFMTKTYNKASIDHNYKSITIEECMKNKYNEICNDLPSKYKTKLFELACFYYFNILTPKLR